METNPLVVKDYQLFQLTDSFGRPDDRQIQRLKGLLQSGWVVLGGPVAMPSSGVFQAIVIPQTK